MARSFKFQVRLPNAHVQNVTVQADDVWRAQAMVEAQYGQGSIIGSYGEVKEQNSSPSSDSPSPPGANLAILLGVAVFGLLFWLQVPWQWAAGVAVAIWIGVGIFFASKKR